MYGTNTAPKKLKEYTPEQSHLRYGVIVADYKTKRYVVARLDSEVSPMVFLREKEPHGESYSLFKGALSAQRADGILNCLKINATIWWRDMER